MKKFLALVLCLAIAFPSLPARADVLAAALNLPAAGAMVHPSAAFTPALVRGITVYPDKPLQFDFIVDGGDDQLAGDLLQAESRRMINYFLAALTVPQQDLWVNLSPVEKDRIIPDALIKTEIGRDLLAQDYILKQLTSSLIYPEDALGKAFWARIYEEAARTGNATDIPVDTFNKVWITPENASVVEKGNTVYIAGVHLKVMLEADYLAMKTGAADMNEGARHAVPAQTEALREMVIPVIEKEVNEGRNFAPLRQAVYALVLAQWYQDVLKASVLNTAYARQNKVAGIDLSDPANKALIYDQYMAAYKKGVFNYIKEEPAAVILSPKGEGSQNAETIPRKYFSGGFSVQGPIARTPAQLTDTPARNLFRVNTNIEAASPAQSATGVVPVNETYEQWTSRERALPIFAELKEILRRNSGHLPAADVRAFLDKYIPQVAREATHYPVQCTWPVLKAIVLLEKAQEDELVAALRESYAGDIAANSKLPLLADVILLMNAHRDNWLLREAARMKGSKVYSFSAEGYPAEGGLGEVIENIIKGFVQIGVSQALLQPWYQETPQGKKIDCTARALGFQSLDENFDTFMIRLGNANGGTDEVKVRVARAIDKNGAEVFLFRDVQPDGTSHYTKILYNYNAPNNPVSKEESMAFLNEASAALYYRLERRRMKEQADWQPAVIDANDGQLLPVIGVLMSRYGKDPVVRDVVYAGKTHTIFNRGENDQAWGVNVFLKNMLRIHPRYFNTFRIGNTNIMDHSSGGLRLAVGSGQGIATGVANVHVRDMEKIDSRGPTRGLILEAMTNGANPEKLAAAYREEFLRLFPDGDVERPTGEQNMRVKQACKARLNTRLAALNIKTTIGRPVVLNPDAMTVGYMRRAVWEKDGRVRALNAENIRYLVSQGANVLLVGRDQGYTSIQSKEFFMALERELAGAGLPGRFFFVTEAGPEAKPDVLAALDLMVQDSEGPELRSKYDVGFYNTEAAGYSEEHPAGAYVSGGKFGPGVISDQGVQMRVMKDGADWKFVSPGEGNTMIPQEDTGKSWLETVYKPLVGLYKSDRVAFYEGAAKTARMIRIMEASATSAANVRSYDRVKGEMEAAAARDNEALSGIVPALSGNEARRIMINGAGREPFVFQIVNDRFQAADPGLRAFVLKVHELEDLYGYDAMTAYAAGPYQTFLRGLFKGTLAYAELDQWLNDLDREALLPVQKNSRLVRFLTALQNRMEEQFLSALITKEEAHRLLRDIGTPFSWQSSFGIEVARSGQGLQDFANQYFRLKKDGQNNVLAYHNRPGAQDIVEHLRDLFSAEPLLTGLNARLQPEFDRLSLLGDDAIALKAEVTDNIMRVLSERVRFLVYRETTLARGVAEDPAQAANAAPTGGIDARSITVGRRGELMARVQSDAAREELITRAPGVQAVIISVQPLTNLQALLN